MVEVKPVTSRLYLKEEVQEVANAKKVKELFLFTKVKASHKLHVVKVNKHLEKVKEIVVPPIAKEVKEIKEFYKKHEKDFDLPEDCKLSENPMDVKRIAVSSNGKFAVLADAKDHGAELFLSVGSGDFIYYSPCSYTVIAKDNRTFYTLTNTKDTKGEQVMRLNIRIPEITSDKKLTLETSCELKMAKSLIGKPLVVPGGAHIVMQVVNRQDFVELFVLDVNNDNTVCKATRKQLGLSNSSSIINLVEIPKEPDHILVLAEDEEDKNAGITAIIWKINIEDDDSQPNGTVIKVFTDIYNKNNGLLLPPCPTLEAEGKEVLWDFGTENEKMTFKQWHDKKSSEENIEQTLKLYAALYGNCDNFLETKIHFEGDKPSVIVYEEFDKNHIYALDSSTWEKYLLDEKKANAPVYLQANEQSVIAVLSDGSVLLIELSGSLASSSSNSMADAKAKQRRFHAAARIAGTSPKQKEKSKTCVLL